VPSTPSSDIYLAYSGGTTLTFELTPGTSGSSVYVGKGWISGSRIIPDTSQPSQNVFYRANRFKKDINGITWIYDQFVYTVSSSATPTVTDSMVYQGKGWVSGISSIISDFNQPSLDIRFRSHMFTFTSGGSLDIPSTVNQFVYMSEPGNVTPFENTSVYQGKGWLTSFSSFNPELSLLASDIQYRSHRFKFTNGEGISVTSVPFVMDRFVYVRDTGNISITDASVYVGKGWVTTGRGGLAVNSIQNDLSRAGQDIYYQYHKFVFQLDPTDTPFSSYKFVYIRSGYSADTTSSMVYQGKGWIIATDPSEGGIRADTSQPAWKIYSKSHMFTAGLFVQTQTVLIADGPFGGAPSSALVGVGYIDSSSSTGFISSTP
jgi:hypothetical protein